MYELNRDRQSITIEGRNFHSDELEDIIADSSDNFRKDLYLFLKEWFSDSDTMIVNTSGSTGTPKPIVVEKEKMMQSAKLTCSFLHLHKGDKALLCMSLNYIAGKMMVVRSLIAGLDLYLTPPCGNPLKDIDTSFDFTAMIPLQVYNSLSTEIERERLSQIKNLIIGGGAIDAEIVKQLKDFRYNIYSTYGMTETLSHIALRKLNGNNPSPNYIPFDSVSLSQDNDGALIIDAPLVSNERLYTNDIVNMDENGSFTIIGRRDNIINSGGIKIQIEELEQLLKPFIKGSFAVSSITDVKFGEIVIIIVEENCYFDKNSIKKEFDKNLIPKNISIIKNIPLTETGKINRNLLKNRIKNLPLQRF